MTEIIPSLKGIPRNSFELEESEGSFLVKNLNGEVIATVTRDAAEVISNMIATQEIADFDGGRQDDFGPTGFDEELIDRPILSNKNDYGEGELTDEQSAAKKKYST